ncbi:MAG: hypothetical protein QM756_29750 [Polyangiaceae bacterium]
MPKRLFTRSLLSLLIVWQLLASALAHPLELPVAPVQGSVTAEQDVQPMAMDDMVAMDEMTMEEHCAEHPLAHADSQAQADQTGMNHPCKSACKCPCAGTPALMAALPTLAMPRPEGLLVLPMHLAHPLTVPVKLLRPPIA